MESLERRRKFLQKKLGKLNKECQDLTETNRTHKQTKEKIEKDIANLKNSMEKSKVPLRPESKYINNK